VNPEPPHARERLTFHGTLDLADFAGWAQHRADKLGLTGCVTTEADTVVADVSGPAELIEAMALCCSLGPASSWVERVDRVALVSHQGGANSPPTPHSG